MRDTKLRKQLEIYVNSLDKDIKRIRNKNDSNKIRNLIAESDANLLEDIKYDLLEILEVEY